MIEKIVVDSNIIFSGLLNINSKIGQILINGPMIYKFYAPEYVKSEILEHSDKIKQLSHQSDIEFVETFELIMRGIRVLNQTLIDKRFYLFSFNLCKDIDPDDTDFVAVTEFVKGQLWTGDKKLSKGLKSKGYERIISTEELFLDFIKSSNLKRKKL